MDHIITDAACGKQLRRLFAMFLWIKFKINIVQQTDNTPIFFLVEIAERFRKETHYAFNCQCMSDVKWLFIAFFKKQKSFFS